MLKKLTFTFFGFILGILVLRAITKRIFDEETMSSESINLVRFISKIFFFALTFYLLKKESFFNWEYILKNNILYIFLSLTLVILSFWATSSYISQHKIEISLQFQIIYLLNYLATGFFEEFLFRVLIFGFVCKVFEKANRKNYYKEIVITSVLFGIIHFLNGIKGATEISGLISQVVLAIILGIVLQCVFYRLNNIIIVAIIHGLFDYFGARDSHLFKISTEATKPALQSELLNSMMAFGILFSISILFSYSLIRNRSNNLIITEVT